MSKKSRRRPSATPSALLRLLDREVLRRMAGSRSFERGEDYLLRGKVGTVVESDGAISARVRGTSPYRVELREDAGGIDYSCSCPVGADGAFCKHCVAVGLKWLEPADAGQFAGPAPPRPAVTMDDVRAHLATMDRSALADLLVTQAVEDDRLRRQLIMKAAKCRPEGLDLATWRAAIDDAIEPDEFIGYREMYGYTRRIDEVIDSVQELLEEEHATEVVELAEHAVTALESAMGSVDDSDGRLGEILHRVQKLHHEACRRARPDPKPLARRLFERELRSSWDAFSGAATEYADVLGERGLAVYRTLAEAEWARVPALAPGEDDPEKFVKRFRITHIMEGLARLTGDVEALVGVRKRDLSHPYAFLRIAEAYRGARKHDAALDWAERGLRAFPQRADSRLREFLADEYHRRKRHDEAMALIWAEFVDRPSLGRYQQLKAHADRLPAASKARAKVKPWQPWREKALAHLRAGHDKAKREVAKQERPWLPAVDHSELVRIFLWERDVEAAWHEAQTCGCANDLWVELAGKRETDHPADVLPVYQRQVEATLCLKKNEAYRAAIGLLRKIRSLMARLGREPDFAKYVASVRAAHKPKRNFIKLLDHAKWS